jgi:perosamine synthetase
MSNRRIPLARPSFGPEELAAVASVLESGWVVQGPRVAEFEERFADMVGVSHAVAMSSCTTALHACVSALGAGPGDEVIVPALTWVATANVVEQNGAKAVFADIDLDTFNVDVRAVEAAVTDRTVGILPVHLFGLAADLPELSDLARRHGLWMIEDAACALGANVGGRHVGTTGLLGCFSFHPRKSITTGEGGMAVTDDARMAELLRSLRDHGSGDSPESDMPKSARMPTFPRVGFNYRMTEIQAAIGVVQLERAGDFITERRRIAARYDEGFQGVSWLVRPTVPEGYVHGYQAYVVLIEEGRGVGAPEDGSARLRDTVVRRLERSGIGCRPGTHAPPLLDYYQAKYGYGPEDFPKAAYAERSSIALPLYPGLSDDEIDFVIDTIRSVEVER